MKDRAISLGDLRDRHTLGYAIVIGVLGGLLVVGYTWLLQGRFGLSVFCGCLFAVVMTTFAYVMNRRIGRVFPPGLDRESRMAVRRIVRTGTPVDDPALAPAVAYFAGAILRVPFRPGLSMAIFGFLALVGALKLISVIGDGDTRGAWVFGSIVALSVVLLSLHPFAVRRRRRAGEAHRQALKLIETRDEHV